MLLSLSAVVVESVLPPAPNTTAPQSRICWHVSDAGAARTEEYLIMIRLPHVRTMMRAARVPGLKQVPQQAQQVFYLSSDTSDKPPGWDEARPYTEIPGPKPLPIIGNLWRFIPFIGDLSNIKIQELGEVMHSRYGLIAKMPVFPGVPEMVSLQDADDIAHVFRNEGAWPVRPGSQSVTYFYENYRKEYPISLGTSQGKEWQDIRTAVNQVMMQPRDIKQYVKPIDQVSQEFINRMKKIRKGQLMPDNFTEEISKWALESITYVALDTRLDILRDLEPDSEGVKVINAVQTILDSMIVLDFGPSPWRHISTPTFRKFIAEMNFFTKVATKYVNVSMERLKSLSPHDLQDRKFSVLENLLVKTQDPQKAISMALDMLLAGVDTTGGLVATVLYQLAINPAKQQKLQEELDRVIPDPTVALSDKQLQEMRYLRACVKETLRVMPIITGNARFTVKDMVIGGYQIPKGVMVTMNMGGMLKQEQYFPRADEFLPERWLRNNEALNCKNPFAYLPFGFGPRMCVGRRFADLETDTLIAKVFRNFSLEWNRPPPKTMFGLVQRFADPLALTVKDRSSV